MGSTTPAIEVRGLKKTFGKNVALAGVDFTVPRGRVVSLLGPNGAGKSTTISIICGLVLQSEGEAEVLGKSVREKPKEVKSKLGIVPQEVSLYSDLTAYENLMFWGRMYGLSGKALKDRVREVLELTGLEERKKEKLEKYSGGMKRRINIGAALLHKPEVLIMDEPTVGIDPQSRRHILDNVKELNRLGVTILYTTHYMEEAQELSDTIIIIDRGRVIANGSHQELVKIVGSLEKVTAELAGDPMEAENLWKKVPGVKEIYTEDGRVSLFTEDSDSLLPKLFTTAHQASIHVRSVDIKQPNLEAVFLHLTGRDLRD